MRALLCIVGVLLLVVGPSVAAPMTCALEKGFCKSKFDTRFKSVKLLDAASANFQFDGSEPMYSDIEATGRKAKCHVAKGGTTQELCCFTTGGAAVCGPEVGHANRLLKELIQSLVSKLVDLKQVKDKKELAEKEFDTEFVFGRKIADPEREFTYKLGPRLRLYVTAKDPADKKLAQTDVDLNYHESAFILRKGLSYSDYSSFVAAGLVFKNTAEMKVWHRWDLQTPTKMPRSFWDAKTLQDLGDDIDMVHFQPPPKKGMKSIVTAVHPHNAQVPLEAKWVDLLDTKDKIVTLLNGWVKAGQDVSAYPPPTERPNESEALIHYTIDDILAVYTQFTAPNKGFQVLDAIYLHDKLAEKGVLVPYCTYTTKTALNFYLDTPALIDAAKKSGAALGGDFKLALSGKQVSVNVLDTWGDVKKKLGVKAGEYVQIKGGDVIEVEDDVCIGLIPGFVQRDSNSKASVRDLELEAEK